ncbi:MAG: RidA family protein [Candidatus Thermoplasmatota archaeon]|nr:RidA family protein [Candidatus Thermoplasmatota archaeon]
MERERVATDTPWEARVGYSRAVRVGPHVYVSGTTATDSKGKIVGEGDPYQQTVQVFRNIRVALEAIGSGLQDVVRTRMYVTDIEAWEEIGRAHGEAFGEVRPAATMVEIRRLIDPDMIVEIEVDAVRPEPP